MGRELLPSSLLLCKSPQPYNPHRRVALTLHPKDRAGAWASELVLGTRVASVILHGCSTVANAARSSHGVVNIGASVPVFKRGIVLVDAGLTLRRLLLSFSSEYKRSRTPLKVNSFVLLCSLSLTTAVCVTRLAVDHQMSPMMIQPTSTHSTCFAIVSCSVFLGECTAQKLTQCLCPICLGFCNVRFQNCDVVPDRRQVRTLLTSR